MVHKGAIMKRFFLFIPFIILLSLISCKEVVVKTPEGFADLKADDQYAAMSPEGMIYRVRIMKNTPQQSLEFWSEALTTHLEQEGYVRVSKDNEFQAGNVHGLFSEWTVPYRGDTYKYLTGVITTGKAIAVAEASGSHLVYAQYRTAVIESLETIQFSGFSAKKISEEDVALMTNRRQKSTPSQSGGCFLPGTLVITESGAVPIDAIWPGTTVYAYDPSSREWRQQTVLRTVSLRYSNDIITIGIAGQTIEVTGNHPFLVADGTRLMRRPLPEELSAEESLSPGLGRWVEARHLRRGDVLVSLDHTQLRVDSVSMKFVTTEVYHLAISGPCTYAVYPGGIVVHNGGAREAPKEALLVTDEREREIIGAGVLTASLPADAQSERIRVYSGACTLVVESVEQVKREISIIAEEVGGYVELSSDKGIVIRIPAGVFRTVFDDILDFGEVLHKAIETYDVTEQFTDPEGRLAVAIRARDRLYALLKRVQDPKERLEILKKIREYSETIERLQLSLQVLEKRIALSRITVDLRPRLADTDMGVKPVPFEWIERLHPLYSSTEDLRGAVAVSLPEDVALFQEKGVLRAEAADGTRLRIGTVENDPRGDTSFWRQALVYHLRFRYQDAEEIDLESMKMALFTSKDRSPYYYLIGTIPLVEKPRLAVFEVYFPDSIARDRHLNNLLAAFGSVEVK